MLTSCKDIEGTCDRTWSVTAFAKTAPNTEAIKMKCFLQPVKNSLKDNVASHIRRERCSYTFMPMLILSHHRTSSSHVSAKNTHAIEFPFTTTHIQTEKAQRCVDAQESSCKNMGGLWSLHASGRGCMTCVGSMTRHCKCRKKEGTEKHRLYHCAKNWKNERHAHTRCCQSVCNEGRDTPKKNGSGREDARHTALGALIPNSQ